MIWIKLRTVGNAETYMFQMGKHIDFWDEIKGLEFEDDVMVNNK